MTDLLDLATRDTTLRRTASTGGGEWCGPCPRGGGHDRFHVWPEKGRYWCRQCNKKGDAIQYLRDFRGLSFIEAKRALGIDPSPPSQQARAKAIAHRLALAAAKQAYQAWERQRVVSLTDEYRHLLSEKDIAEAAFRQMHRRPDLYREEEKTLWIYRLANLYDRLVVLEHDLDVLTYRKNEDARFKYWQEEVEHGRLSA